MTSREVTWKCERSDRERRREVYIRGKGSYSVKWSHNNMIDTHTPQCKKATTAANPNMNYNNCPSLTAAPLVLG